MDKARLDEIVNNRHPFYPYPTDQVEEIITAFRDAWEQLAAKDARIAELKSEIERLRAQLGDWGEELADRDAT